MSKICLSTITTTAERRHIINMITTLYQEVITLPLVEFHKTITQREELLRIKNVTSPSLLHATATKVAETLLKERPAERPVLAGLIREETEKSTSGLKRQLKSALDQLEITKQTLQTLKHAEVNPKNKRGSNMTWSRSPPVEDGDSSVAAGLSPTFQPFNAHQSHPRQPHTAHTMRASTTTQQLTSHQTAFPPHRDYDSDTTTLPMRVRFVPATNFPRTRTPGGSSLPRTTLNPNYVSPADNPFRTVVNNATAARRRQINKRRQHAKFSKKSDSSPRK